MMTLEYLVRDLTAQLRVRLTTHFGIVSIPILLLGAAPPAPSSSVTFTTSR